MTSCPDNHNLAQGSKFMLAFPRLPNLSFFCKSVNLPGVTLGSTEQPTPFLDVPVAGIKLEYETLNATFLVDEPFKTWESIYNWMSGNLLEFPIPQQGVPAVSEKAIYSDAILYVYTNKNNPSFLVKFTDLFPISLSSVQFSTEESAETVMTADVVFKFAYYKIERP